MKFLSLKCRGLVSPIKNNSLKRLMSVNQTNFLLLQETLGKGNDIEKLLVSIFLGCSFSCIDVSGRSGCLYLGWNNRSIKSLNIWGFDLGQGMISFSSELGAKFIVLNTYGPYCECVPFWETFLRKYFFEVEALILERDLNFCLGMGEGWGPRVRYDPLVYFFKIHLERKRLIDVPPSCIHHT
jgi:hypothetical protein